MGGTSSDVSVVIDGHVGETGEGAIDGLPVRLPMIEIRTIGAGGGSVATRRRWRASGRAAKCRLDAGAGVLPNGRRRAATVTDANLVSWADRSGRFLGGEMTLSARSRTLPFTALAHELGLAPDAAATGHHRRRQCRDGERRPAQSCSKRAPIRPTSCSRRSAAQAGCMPARSPANSTSTASFSRLPRRRFRRAAFSTRTYGTTFRARS